MLFEDRRFAIGEIDSIDIDPAVAAVAETLNAMPATASGPSPPTCTRSTMPGGADLIVNTSCEHIADLRGWLDLLPKGTSVLLQSNDYFSEPTHINCVESVEAFEKLAGLPKSLSPARCRPRNTPASC